MMRPYILRTVICCFAVFWLVVVGDFDPVDFKG